MPFMVYQSGMHLFQKTKTSHMAKNNKNRETLSDSVRVSRFFILPIVLVLIWGLVTQIVDTSAARFKTYIIIFFFLALYRLLYHIRRLQYDTDTLYLVYGRQENPIPFNRIISLTSKPEKWFGMKAWLLVYKDERHKTQSRRFYMRKTRELPRRFLLALDNANPDINFNMPRPPN